MRPATGTVSLVSPFRCRMWDLHDRNENELTEASCRNEIESFTSTGQLVPVLGRPLLNDPGYDVELIFGARRLFVARHLNLPLAVDIRPMTDREGIMAMDAENRLRVDVSPYERGRCYSRLLQGKHFASQEDLASTLNISASQVSRLLRVARLPTVIVNAFSTSASIRETWGLALIDIWEDPERQPALARRARALGSVTPRLPPEEVYKELLTARIGERRRKAPSHDEVVKDTDGSPLFRVRRHCDSVSIVLPMTKVPDSALKQVLNAVKSSLQATTIPVERPTHNTRPYPSLRPGRTTVERRVAEVG